jgi:type IV pilus assembly protein PilY1
MKTSLKIITSALVLCQVAWLTMHNVHAAPPGPLTLSQTPLFYGTQQKPIVMLNLTKDNQLHFKAYTDYSDLDDDGKPELTYKHSFDYYGYWDPQKCYDYDATGGVFVPVKFSADKFCDGTKWSGNFLNWVATSRMDSVRKILYGGKRSTDTTTNTVLERNFLPMDAHSWAKFYDAKDLRDKNGNPKSLQDLVPSSLIGTLATFATASGTTYTANNGATVAATAIDAVGDYFITPSGALSARVGDQIELTQAVAGVVRYGRVKAITGTRLTINVPNATDGIGVKGAVGDAAKTSSWTLANLSASGLTFCNTTFVANGSSTTANAPPLIRVARGNTELWAANERWQCGYQGEKTNPSINSGGGFSASGQNGNYFPFTGLKSNAESPPTTYKVNDYTARIEACVDQSSTDDPQAIWAKREGCKAYGTKWKPVGLLQKQDGFKFGLFTGSYTKNIAGGVLRSNVGDFSLEVDTSGRFIDPAASPALAAKGSIVKTLDAIRMTGYSYNDGTYFGAVSKDNCDFQLTDLVLASGATGITRSQGSCASWGNPIAEMYTESLRYLAGVKTPDTNFDYATVELGSVDAALGLKIITWQDPLPASQNNYCTPLKNIIFNAATTSYDGDQVNMVGLAGAGTPTTSASNYTKIVGDREGIKSGIAGNLAGAVSTSAQFKSCTNKAGDLSQFRGICPEGASYSGSYLAAGVAYYARNNPIRSDLTIPKTPVDKDGKPPFPNALTVETFGVSLANNTPKIDIFKTIDGKPTVIATITPAYRLVKGNDFGGGTIVDFKIIEPAPDFTDPLQVEVKGKYYINWEDSGFGGDFDQDVIGSLDFTFNKLTNKLTVKTSTINESTGSPQGFGYLLSGAGVGNGDGPHFHSGIEGFTNKDDATECPASEPCQVGQNPTSRSYTLIGTANNSSLKEPLYYAAKWGAIRDPATETPKGAELAAGDKKFDQIGKTNSSGVDGPDGIPDNYFNVSNPAKLVEQLDALFNNIQRGSSSSSAAASTTRASTDTLVFTASFNGATWNGFLRAFSVDVSNPLQIDFPLQWDASAILKAQALSTRRLFTTNSSTRAGVAFAWGDISADQRADLTSEDVKNYIAGDQSNEGDGATKFRKRSTVDSDPTVKNSVLGDIINSNPAYSSEKADFSGAFSALPGYADFFKQFDKRQSGKKRDRAIFVGANDGMLHAFNGDNAASGGGTELFAYVPSMIYKNLPLLTKQTYNVAGNHQYFVDGSPFVSDANLGTAAAPNWKTVLLGGLGAGGAGFFALDVTRPGEFKVTSVLWEFTAADANRNLKGVTKSDLGASTTQPRIARTKNNGESWFAVFGNGYNSTTTPTHGQAVLFVARLGKAGSGWTSADLYKIVLSDTNDTDNGLSTPTLVDYDRDGFVDFIYAGDLQGNLWRIDARNADPDAWTGKKLFATNTGTPASSQPGQRITTAPQVTRHPNGGLIIMFGTGKYLETSDVSTIPDTQALYGVIDADPTAAAVTTQNYTNLNKVTIVGKTLPVAGPSESQCQVDKGWYANLNSGAAPEGERNVFDGALVAGTLFMPTLVPSADVCYGGGKSYLYSINPFSGCASGTALADETVGIQSTPRFIAIQPAPLGLNSSTGGGKTIETDEAGRQTTKLRVILLGNTDGKPVSVGSQQGRDLSVSSGRLSWREIVSE